MLKAFVDVPGVSVELASCTVIPVGAPVTVMASGPLKVPVGDGQDSCAVADKPARKLIVFGLLTRPQPGRGATTSVTVAVLVMPPPVTVTVSG